MRRNVRSATRLLGVGVALAVLGIAMVPAPTQAIVAKSGTCILDLEATVSGDTINFKTLEPADGALVNLCVLEDGGTATGALSGSFAALAVSFECYEAVGTGLGHFGYKPTVGISDNWTDLGMAVAKVGDGIQIGLSHVGTDFIFTGVGEFLQAPPSAQVCLTEQNPVRWVGSFTWEDPVFE